MERAKIHIESTTTHVEFTFYLYISVKFDDESKQKADDQLLNSIDENVVMNALDGFLIILSTDGDVIYVSENIHEHIGIQQVAPDYNKQQQKIPHMELLILLLFLFLFQTCVSFCDFLTIYVWLFSD